MLQVVEQRRGETVREKAFELGKIKQKVDKQKQIQPTRQEKTADCKKLNRRC